MSVDTLGARRRRRRTANGERPCEGAPTTVIWTANVSGVVAPYTYQWTYRGFVAGASSSFAKTYSYVGYNADFSSTLGSPSRTPPA